MMLIRLKNWTMNIFILKQKIPESVSVQPVLKGSPLYPGRQEQIGRWDMTWHWVLIPQGFKLQGLVHFCSRHDNSLGQSVLPTHNKFSSKFSMTEFS